MAVVLAHIQRPAPAPRQANPAIPPELEAVILRCVEKTPSKRYQRVEDILEDLERVSTRLDATAA
jgi:serine/threonine protein kinase